jgi:phosphotransferase system enzyme I (PtsP)
MNATSLPRVKKALRNFHMSEARSLLEEVMALDDSAAIHARLEAFLAAHGMRKFIHHPLGQ